MPDHAQLPRASLFLFDSLIFHKTGIGVIEYLHCICISSDLENSKTQLAFDFCSKYQTDHPDALVIWIGVETKSYLEERLQEIAEYLSITDQTNISENIVSWLRLHSRDDWVLVLDDVDKEFQPKSLESNDGTSLISSTVIFRSLEEDMKTLEDNLRNTMKSKEARVILPYPTLNDSLQIFEKHCRNIPWDTKIAEQMVLSLEFSPLAISIAAAYMEDNSITLDKYLGLLRKSDLGSISSRLSTPVSRALMLSLRQLQSERPQALGICNLIAVLDRQSVVESLLFYDRKRYDARNFYGSLRKLQLLSLVQRSAEDYHYSMHRLVRDFFLEYLQIEGKLEAQRQLAVQLLSNRYPYGDKSFWPVCRTYNPHAEKAIMYNGPDVWPRAALLRSMTSYHQNCGRHATAYAYYMEVRQICASHGPLSEKQEDLMVDVSLRAAQMLGLMSKFNAGEKLLHNTIGRIKSKVEPGKPQLIHARSLQAWFCSWRGQHAEAERLWRLCLEDNIKIYYETHVDTFIYQSNIATALIEQEKYLEAEEMLAQNIRGRISIRGTDHPDIIASQEILAVVYYRQGKYKEAEALNREILNISHRIQGSENPTTLNIINNLSLNLLALGRVSEGEVMQWRLLASRERQFGSLHEEVAKARFNLAVTLEKLGKYSLAEEQNRLALEAQKKLFPSDNHPTTMNMMNTLGILLLRQEKYEQAEPVLREVLKARREVLGTNHYQTLISQNNLAGLLMKRKKYGESATLLRETIETAKKTNGGEDNAFILRMTNSLSEVMRQGAVDIAETERRSLFLQALELQRIALAGRTRIFGEDHPDVFTSQYNLAHLLHDMERCLEARPLYEKAVEGLGRKLGKNHPVTIECEENFEVCKSQG
jgi:tetratricopeptide (TPR) repeat protein